MLLCAENVRKSADRKVSTSLWGLSEHEALQNAFNTHSGTGHLLNCTLNPIQDHGLGGLTLYRDISTGGSHTLPQRSQDCFLHVSEHGAHCLTVTVGRLYR